MKPRRYPDILPDEPPDDGTPVEADIVTAVAMDELLGDAAAYAVTSLREIRTFIRDCAFFGIGTDAPDALERLRRAETAAEDYLDVIYGLVYEED
jgi:hypothetical protein